MGGRGREVRSMPSRRPVPVARDHRLTTQEQGEGRVQARCSCGWHSPVFGEDKTTGTMDPLQQAVEAGDLHAWEMSMQ